MKIKIIIVFLILLSQTLKAETYLILPKNSNQKLGKKFLKVKKSNANRLLSVDQENKLSYLQNIKEVTKEELNNLNPNDYELVETIRKLKIEQNSKPNDPEYSEQWSLKNTNADKAWAFGSGEGIIVAVVDTGIDYEHEDLKESLWINSGEDINNNGRFDPWPIDSIFNGTSGDFDLIDSDGNGFVDDVIGYDFIDQELTNFGDYLNPDPDPDDEQDHGTTVSGIIAATQNNELGISGVAYNSKIMTLRAFDAGGEGESDDVARSIIYSALNGADIINMSFGESFKSPIVAAAIEFAYSLGCVMVSSAGNSNNFRPHYPSDLPEVISVAGTNRENDKYGFSNYGSYIDLAAPGSDVLTTSIGNEYRRVNGTSYSAPFVAAAAAFILEKNPGLKPSVVKSILQSSCFDLGENGWDEDFGAGIIDISKAVNANINSDFSINKDIFETSYNTDELDSLTLNGTISIPLMTGFKVYLGEGHFPDRLSNEDAQYILDSLNRIDSLDAIENNRTFVPREMRNFIIPNQNQIENFKWDEIFSSDERFLNEDILKIDLKEKKDTTYTVRFVVNLFNNKTLEKRIKFYLYDNTSTLSVNNSGTENMLFNGINRVAVYASTNKEAISEVSTSNYSKQENDYRIKNHFVLIDENLDGESNVKFKFERFNENSSSISIPINPDNYEVSKESFKRVSDRSNLFYLYNGVEDFDSDGNTDLIVNDLSTLAIGNTLHYEYEQGDLNLKQDLEEAWLPVGYGDTDGDGLIETFATAGFEFRLFEEDESGENPFAKVLYSDDNSFRWGEGLYDFDGDGREELILNDEFGYYLVSYKNGKYEQIATAEIPLEIEGFGTERFGIAGDFNKDGTNQLCISNRLGHVMFFEFSQADTAKLELTQYFSETVSLSRQFLQAVDLDGDGKDEIVSLNNGNRSFFEEGSSLEQVWRLRVFSLSGSLYSKSIDKYIYGVQEGLLGNSGISYKNGMTSGELDGEIGEEIVVSTFPNLYVFKYENNDLKPIWHVPNALSNSAVINDFDGNGKNELGITTFSGFAFYEYNNDIELDAPRNFTGYALDEESALLEWNINENADKYEIFQLVSSTSAVKIDETTSTNYIVNGLENNTFYRFLLKACKDDNCSDFTTNLVEVYTHTPISMESVEFVDLKTLILKYDGKLGLNDPAPSLFYVEQDGVKSKPSNSTRASDSTLILTFNEDFTEGDANAFSGTFRDFYNTPTRSGSIEFEIDTIGIDEEVYIKSFEIQESSLIGIEFSSEMSFGVSERENYVIEPFGTVLSVDTIPNQSSKVQIFLSSDAVFSRGKEYVLTVKNIFSKDSVPITKGPGASISFSFSKSLLDNVYMYPHPVSRDNDQYYFANLTASCRVVVINYDGVAIKELIENDGNGGVEWDGTDLNGNKLKPGIYFWKAIDDEQNQQSSLQKMLVK